MSEYSAEQLDAYFEHIGYPKPKHAQDPLVFVTELQKHQLARIPFENLALHYSADAQIPLEPQFLFEKFIKRGRGGYCHENNRFFSEILRSLGFQVTNVICRISRAFRGLPGGGWRELSHMANLVAIGELKYLVDVGFGADEPCCPIPLVSGVVTPGLPGQELILEYKGLPQHTDPAQRVWVLSQRKGSNSDWLELYHFFDIECFPADFEVLSHFTMTRAWFPHTIFVQKFLFDGAGDGSRHLSAVLILIQNKLKQRNAGSSEEILLETLKTEEQRIAVLERYFQIRLTEEERKGIEGRASEIKG
ncbi:hypothetical protein BX600DRAFT_393410 [Xylariales sp. PMI_506]|nr:hypothetical protein BX600DRAFT_393410 [Xylariales sp. PMI_506]